MAQHIYDPDVTAEHAGEAADLFIEVRARVEKVHFSGVTPLLLLPTPPRVRCRESLLPTP